MERVELHCHSKYSKMDGVAYPYDIVNFAEKEGMPAVAITDHGCILGFPEFEWATQIGQCEVKPLFGIEAYVVNDYEKAVYNYKGQDITTIVAVDIETTGFSAIKDEIIEISGIKICNGELKDRFNILVNPGINIPKNIEELTGITNEMVSRAPYIENAFMKFSKFAGNNVLVAHDANFYIRFLKAAAIKAGVNYDPAYIDTKMLCRYVYPDFQGYTLNSVCEELEIDIEPYCCTVDAAAACGTVFSKAIERLKNEDVDIGSVNNIIKHCSGFFTKSETYHCTVLLKNPKGKKIIYNMISQAEQNKGRMNRDVFSLRELCNNRNNLLLGSGCEAGLLFRAIIDDKSEEEIEEIARCFDFIEVQPHMNNKYMLEDPDKPHIQTEQDLIDINLKLILLGEKLNIPVVATGDVHYLNHEDLLSRNVLWVFNGLDEDNSTDLHFRTTKEMLEAFSYLSEEKAKEIVITNTNKIADMCELISFLPEGKHYPVNENNPIELRNLCEHKLIQMYKNVSSEMTERLDWELEAIHNTNTEFAFIFLHRIIENLGLRPFNINIPGCAGNIFVCYLLGISDIDPIQYNLSPYFVFGLDRMKEADIDLNFSSKMRKKAITDCRRYEGISSTLLASTENCISEEVAIEAVENYQRERNVNFSEEKFKKIIGDLQDIYESKCVHPSGMILVPEDDVLQEFTPIAITEDGQAITYFNYDRLDNRFYKQDILPYFGLDMLEKLEEITGEIPEELTYSEPEIMTLFLDCDGVMGCDDLPEFRCQDSMEILKKAKPKNFDELVKVFALCHGKNVWNDNVEILLEQGKADLSEIISSGDDIYDFLRNKGIDEENAYIIAEQVRKGKWLYGRKKRYLEYVEMLQAAGVAEWFIWSCCKVYCLCSRAHAISYAKLNWRLGWYKVHYPKQYAKMVEGFINSDGNVK